MIRSRDHPLDLGARMRLNHCYFSANHWIRGTVVLKQSMKELTTVCFTFQTLSQHLTNTEPVNKVVCQDLLSDETHFNPYQVNLQRIGVIPGTYIKILVSAAGFHRLMLHGPEPAACSALVQKDLDIFALRAEALGELNDSLSRSENQTSDATLLSVIALMVTSVSS